MFVHVLLCWLYNKRPLGDNEATLNLGIERPTFQLNVTYVLGLTPCTDAWVQSDDIDIDHIVSTGAIYSGS